MTNLRYKIIQRLDIRNVPSQHPKHMKYYGDMVIWDYERNDVSYNTKQHIDSMDFITEKCNELNRKHEERISYLNEVSNYVKR